MSMSKQVPRDKCIDNTLALWQEGYLFIKNRVDRYGSNLFETHLLGKKVICMSGKEASKLFYNTELFKRKGALPKRVQKTLFGLNAVQTMDDESHIHRKMLFMSVLDREYEKQLTEITRKRWQEAINKWENAKQIVLFDEVNNILCQSVCEWARVPLQASKIKERAKDFSTMVNTLESIGLKYWQGKRARARTEKWIKGIIEDTRAGKLKVETSSVVYKVAFYEDLDGKLLDAQMAAIELINILRPTVAISRFITFMALALYEHGEYIEELRLGDENTYEMFIQEVRRYYPFAPFLGGIVKKNFIWNGCKFKKGRLVLIDIYGTNHDSRIWDNPYAFRPERFKERKNNLFDFIPQGGGDSSKGHRCPGEGITIALMKLGLDILINQIEFKIPEQDLSYSLIKIPSLPKSEFIMSNIRRKPQYASN